MSALAKKNTSPFEAIDFRVINIERLLTQYNNDLEMIETVASKFLENYEMDIDQIEDAIQAEDHEGLATACHKFKGSVSYLLVAEATQTASALHKLGLNGTVVNADKLFTKLQSILDDLIKDLRHLMSESKGQEMIP